MITNKPVSYFIKRMKDDGHFSKENDYIDYKRELNISSDCRSAEDILLNNLGKDILAFMNNKGGIIFLGFEEQEDGNINPIGLNCENLKILKKIDQNIICQKITSIIGVSPSIDLQIFQMVSNKYYYLKVDKSDNVVVPKKDSSIYKIKKGEVLYRGSGKNETANISSEQFNAFLSRKIAEKNKAFMEIWAKIFPEIIEINPKDILIINPNSSLVYGYNKVENKLSSSPIEIDDSKTLSIILESISDGKIEEISDDDGKPIYKIIGMLSIAEPRDYIIISRLCDLILSECTYKVTSIEIKKTTKYLEWTLVNNYKIINPPTEVLNENYSQYIWVQKVDSANKIVFSHEAKAPLLEVINNRDLHMSVFGKELSLKD